MASPPAELDIKSIISTAPKLPPPNHANIPDELIDPSPKISEKRARFIENRVKKIIASQVGLIGKGNP